MGSSISVSGSSEISSDEAKYEDAVTSMENGDESAKTTIALFKLSGRAGVELDYDGAVALLEERTAEGDGEAMWMLGLCCEYGVGIQQDVGRARLLYQQSFEANNVLGWFLSKGLTDWQGFVATGKVKMNYWLSL